ncbi:SRPBCC domain-containing protein [Tenacibaculum aiptasiae]|uniref:SRPBCC domain-containing protein n=1 Tax=Tenacibaculum aiptasiae TaxID=426481 RepID=UPI0023300581|nr:SRPBCC domain-containing protein [Tenacibaculum aiptasiae]
MSLEVHVKDVVRRNIEEVFKAIVDKEKISKYFVSEASANLVEGTEVKWEWKDFGAECMVNVLSVTENKEIVFSWAGNQIVTEVEMKFTSNDDATTEVNITEKSYENTPEGIKKTMQQTQGWTDFLCSLKAYLYTGINLRNGKMN